MIKKLASIATLAMMILFCGTGLFAQVGGPFGSVTPLTGDNLIYSDALSHKFNQKSSKISNGFVSLWFSGNYDYSGIFLNGQVLDFNGNKVGNLFHLNSTDPNSQVVAVPGGFIVIWVNSDIYGQRFDEQGNKIGTQFNINTDSGFYYCYYPQAAILPQGIFVVWGKFTSTEGNAVYGQIINFNGEKIGPIIKVNTSMDSMHSDGQNQLQIKIFNEEVIVIWEFYTAPTNDLEVYGQIFDFQGNKRGSEFRVNSTVTGIQSQPELSPLSDGFIVIWSSDGQSGDPYQRNNICYQLFNADGSKRGPELLVNNFKNSEKWWPTISISENSFLVIWQSYSLDGGGSDVDIYGQIFDLNGTKQGAEFRINSYDIDNQANPNIFSIGNNYVIAWDSAGQDGDGTGIFGKIVNSNGALGPEFQINSNSAGNQSNVKLLALQNTFIATWDSKSLTGNDSNISMRSFGLTAITLVARDASGTIIPNDAWSNSAFAAVSAEVLDPVTSTPVPVNEPTWQYSINGGAWINGKSANIIAEGITNVNFQVQDINGNILMRSTTVRIDRSAPVVTVSGNTNWTNIAPVVLTASASDSLSGAGTNTFEYKVGDSGAWQPGNTASVSIEGATQVSFRISDAAGNIGTGSVYTRIDTTPPVITLPTGWTNGSVTAQATDAVSGVDPATWEYSLNGAIYRPGQTIVLTSSGYFSVAYRVRDFAGNTVSSSGYVKADMSPPHIGVDIAFQDNNAILTASADDSGDDYDSQGSGVDENSMRYNIDGGVFINGGIAVVEPGVHTVRFEVLDFMSNKGVWESTKDFTYQMDLGNIIKVNSDSVNYLQYEYPAFLKIENGFVTAWATHNIDSNLWDIRCQRLDNKGDKAGNEIAVSVPFASFPISNSNSFFRLASFPNGFIITWTVIEVDENQNNVYCQIFDNEGNKLGNVIKANTNQNKVAYDPQVKIMEDCFWVLWQSSLDGTWAGTYGQIFDFQGNKIGSELDFNLSDGTPIQNVQIELKNENILIIGNTLENGATRNLYCQFRNHQGMKIRDDLKLNPVINGSNYIKTDFKFCVLSDGFAVLWNEAQTNYESSIYGQLYDVDWHNIGDPVLIDSSIGQSYLKIRQLYYVEKDSSGLAIYYQAESTSGYSRIFIKKQYDLSSHVLSEMIMYPNYNNEWIFSNKKIGFGDKDIFLLWGSLNAQLYDKQGNRLGEMIIIDNQPYNISFYDTEPIPNGFAAVWTKNGAGVFVRILPLISISLIAHDAINNIVSNNKWSNSSSVTVSAEALENFTSSPAGVNNTTWQYTLNNGVWIDGSCASVSIEGDTSVSFRVQDQTGTWITGSTEVKLDRTNPVISIQQENWPDDSVSLTAYATDDVAGITYSGVNYASFQYNVDNSGWQNGSSVTITSTGMHTVVFRVDDNAGNTGEAEIEIAAQTDTTPPVLTIPSDITTEATAINTFVDIGQATATDDSGVTITNNAPAGKLYPLGVTIVTWTAADASGNTSTATQKVTIADTTKPMLTVPGDITTEATAVNTPVSIGQATATDIFSVTITNNAPAGNLYPLGVTLVTWTATDTSGNTSGATQKVTINDTIPPSQPSNVTATALSSSSVLVAFNVSGDNIGIAGYDIYRGGVKVGNSLVNSYTDTGLSPLTTYSYFVQAVDKAGNLSISSSPVTVMTLDSGSSSNPPYFTINPYVRSVSDTLAVIEFAADKPANAVIQYGPNTSYGQSITIGDYLSSHTATLTGLAPGSLYHFKVSINDFNSNGPVSSGDVTFYTQSLPDTLPPVFLSQPLVIYVSDTIAIIEWSANEDTLGEVFYGTGSVSENNVGETVYGTSHSVTLTSLLPGASYVYKIEIRDRALNGPVSSQTDHFITLSMPDTNPPVITSGPAASYIGTVNAIISWVTNEPSDSLVRFGTVSGVYDFMNIINDSLADHAVELNNLIENTTYYYVVYSKDIAGNTSTQSAEASFKTAKKVDTTPPALKKISETTSDVTAAIHWETDEAADGIVVYGTASGVYTLQFTMPDFVAIHDINCTNLAPSTTYYYRIHSSDPSGNESISAERTFTTQAQGSVTPLTITNITDTVTTTKVIIDWVTNNKATTRVYYKKSTDASWQIVEDTKLAKSHTTQLIVKDLASGTYYYKVYSKDEFNQELEKNADDLGNIFEFIIP